MKARKMMGIAATCAFAGLLGVSGAAWAQAKATAGGAPAGGGDNVTYKQKTVYDFEDDTVEGDLQRPDGELVNGIRKVKQASLIEIRQNFIPEMLKSLEDI